jgi:hypothetical protein
MFARRDPLGAALNTLSTIALGAIDYKNQLENKEKQNDTAYDRQARAREIERIQKIYPDMSTFDYGDPVRNEQDFNQFRSDFKLKTDMINKGKSYKPVGGIMSQEMQEDLFTYGATRYSLDNTAGILSYDDLLNYDAWLLGDLGIGKDIAKRHNWKGLLNNYNDDLEGYVLDQDDYIDLKEKGLVDILEPSLYDDSIYVLSEGDKTSLIKKYDFWKSGFISQNQPPTRSQISESINQNNIANSKKLDNMLKQEQFKLAFENINRWRPGSENEGYGLVDDDGKFVTDYINEEGEQGRDRKSKEDFMEEFPNVYNWLYMNQSFESAVSEYGNNLELQAELKKMPLILAQFENQWNDFTKLENEKRRIGIIENQDQYIMDSRIMGDARDIVLNDLQSIGNGILFNDDALNNLTNEQLEGMLNNLAMLEQSYATPGTMDYNTDIVKFLSLYTNIRAPKNKQELTLSGGTLLNLINELKNKGQ